MRWDSRSEDVRTPCVLVNCSVCNWRDRTRCMIHCQASKKCCALLENNVLPLQITSLDLSVAAPLSPIAYLLSPSPVGHPRLCLWAAVWRAALCLFFGHAVTLVPNVIWSLNPIFCFHDWELEKRLDLPSSWRDSVLTYFSPKVALRKFLENGLEASYLMTCA